jgi:hypothetical protein
MKAKDLGTWAALLLVPGVPVFAFYLVFKESNLVEIHEVPTGIVATGPIAAYIVLLWVGSRLSKQFRSEPSPLSPAEEEFVDTAWSFQASSQHGSRDGQFTIGIDDRGRLVLTGNFELAGRNVGSWSSTMAQCQSKRLEVLYDLSESGKGKVRESTGFLAMATEPDDPDTMAGSWIVLGDGQAFGELRCRRIHK